MHDKCRAALLKACRIFGGQKQLADKINIHPSRLNKWINRNKKSIPYACAIEIENVTQEEVTCEELLLEWGKIAKNCQYTSTEEKLISDSEMLEETRKLAYDKEE